MLPPALTFYDNNRIISYEDLVMKVLGNAASVRKWANKRQFKTRTYSIHLLPDMLLDRGEQIEGSSTIKKFIVSNIILL